MEILVSRPLGDDVVGAGADHVAGQHCGMALVGHFEGDGAGVGRGVAWRLTRVDDADLTTVPAVEFVAFADDAYWHVGFSDCTVEESRLFVHALGAEHLGLNVDAVDSYGVWRVGAALADSGEGFLCRVDLLGSQACRVRLAGGAGLGGGFFAGVDAAWVLCGVLGVGERRCVGDGLKFGFGRGSKVASEGVELGQRCTFRRDADVGRRAKRGETDSVFRQGDVPVAD